MKKTLLFLLVFMGVTALGQDYSFLSSTSRKTKAHEYVYYLNDPANIKDSTYNKPKYYLENGKQYGEAYRDSISKSEDRYKYLTIGYRDTITNQFSFVLHKRTDEELEKEQEYWKNYTEEDKKTGIS
ncbi:hypothetical protein [Flavobacterium rhizosphaerae]|uniref:Uncharacterized protein n=1 Tax=Flavobacterium rhizosphaerae TaxID=3163298 RepID=A0ABW8YRW6_9FLAO